MTHDWSDTDKQAIADHLHAGLSAGQIAKALPFDTTRNAIIGIVQRNGSLKAIGFARAAGIPKSKPRRKPDPPQEKKPPQHKPENRFMAAVKGGLLHRSAKALPAAPPPPRAKAIGIPLVDIASGQCRWPLWDMDGAPDFLMCGAATPVDRSYCAAHAARTSTGRAG